MSHHPTISITQHGATSTKMHISPPRINLRRAGSYNTADRGPLSSSSSRFNFDHLAFYSPPPSPGLPLPQQIPRQNYRRGRKLSNTRLSRPSRVIRGFIWLSGLALLFYLVGKSVRTHRGPESLLGSWVSGSWDGSGGDGEKEYEMVGQDDLPDFPTPIIVTDRRGRAKWTISIPPSYEFPLSQREYVDMCAKCKEVSQRVASMHSHGAVTTAIVDQISLMAGSKHAGAGVGPFAPETDKYFLDITPAQSLGFLPAGAPPRSKSPGRVVGELLGVDGATLVSKTICASSLTFVLESDDAGLGNTLLALWMAYGLAQREGRAFFLDDARWAYGAFTDVFEAPPQPECRPPPRHEMLPCPRQARHLVVSAANARAIFGGEGLDDVDDIKYAPAKGLDAVPGQRELYSLARLGYEALFRLTASDREYVAGRVAEHRGHGVVVGVHVRHGDCHPLEFQYHDSYMPLTQYVDAATELLNASLASSHPEDAIIPTAATANESTLVIASDDPLVYDAAEFSPSITSFTSTIRAQELIRLAGKEEITGGASQPPQPKNVMHKFTAESFGWEGGFFAPMFWHLGALPLSPSAANAQQQQHALPPTNVPPTAETLGLRSLVGRSYLMDLASLAAMTDDDVRGGGVVCAVSAMGCRILAVMMGEERAFRRGQWRNVDGDFGWNGLTW